MEFNEIKILVELGVDPLKLSKVKSIVISVETHSTKEEKCKASWNVLDDNNEILSMGVESLTPEEYNSWNENNESLENIVLTRLGLIRL